MRDVGNIVMTQAQMIAEQKNFEKKHGQGERHICPGIRGSEIRYTYPDGARWTMFCRNEDGKLVVDGFYDSDRNYTIKVK